MEKERSKEDKERLDAKLKLLSVEWAKAVKKQNEQERELTEGKKEPPTQGDLFNSEEP